MSLGPLGSGGGTHLHFKGSKPEAATAGWSLVCCLRDAAILGSVASTLRIWTESSSSTTCATRRRRGAAGRRRLHRRRRGRRLRRSLADLAARSRTAGSPRSPSTPRDAARRGRRPRPSPRWSRARRCSRRRAIGIDEVDAALGGLTPAKRHAAQLAADALHRALAARRRLGRRASPTADRREPRRWSPCPAASTAPSPRCSSASAGRRWSASRSSSGPTPRPTAPRPAARRRRCSAPAALAHSLGIPHLTLDLEEEFRRRVVGRFLDGYAAGSTPNPCIALQRRGADRGDDRPRRAARRRRASSPATTPASSTTATGRCSPPPPTRPRTRATCSPRCRRSCSAGSRFPLDRADQARGARDRRPPRPRGRPEAREPGPLLPRRPGQARASCAATAASRDREGAVLDRARPRRRPPPRPPQLHRRPAPRASASPRPSRSTSSPPTPPPTRSRSAPAPSSKPAASSVRDAVLHRDGARVDAVRLRYHSRALPASIGAAGAGRHDALEVELGEEFVGASPGQTAVLLAGETIVGHGTIAAAA